MLAGTGWTDFHVKMSKRAKLKAGKECCKIVGDVLCVSKMAAKPQTPTCGAIHFVILQQTGGLQQFCTKSSSET
jgi:hypothetical protein